MRILIVPSTLNYLNLGDVGMLQVATRRLRDLWPNASLRVLTSSSEVLVGYCPHVEPVVYEPWYSNHYLLGRLHKTLGPGASSALVGLKKAIRNRRPEIEDAALQIKGSVSRFRGSSNRRFEEYLAALKTSDVVVLSGAGSLTDIFKPFAMTLLAVMNRALFARRPIAILSQGLGPVSDPELWRSMQRVLRSARLIALREQRAGLPILESMGVSRQRVVTTGDDAIELACEAPISEPGLGIGVNFRIAEASGTSVDIANAIKPVLGRFAASKRTQMLVLPVARQSNLDAEGTKQVMNGFAEFSDEGKWIDTPAKLINQIQRCRIVVTSAYHAAVFALSLGIPVVCLAKSPYFVCKFLGLQNQFGAGCEVVRLDSPNLEDNLSIELENAWASADCLRSSLRRAAEAQVQAGRAAYERLREVVGS